MVIGTHFFSPANVMRLVEIVRGKATEKPVIATAMALAKTLKKVGVVVRNGFGFVGNRMVFPYMNEAQFLVEEGATPEQVDRALTDFGMAMGPLAMADMSGIDVFWRIQQELPGAGPVSAVDKLYTAGRYGQKTRRRVLQIRRKSQADARSGGAHTAAEGASSDLRPRKSSSGVSTR